MKKINFRKIPLPIQIVVLTFSLLLIPFLSCSTGDTPATPPQSGNTTPQQPGTNTPPQEPKPNENEAYYSVEHWYEKISYDLYVSDANKYEIKENETERKIGEIGDYTKAVAKEVKGFDAVVHDEVIAKNGSTVVKVFYDRKEITLTFDANGGGFYNNSLIPIITVKGKFGKNIPTVEEPTKDRYSFTGWTPLVPFTFPDENASFTANWEKSTEVEITVTLPDAPTDVGKITYVQNKDNIILTAESGYSNYSWWVDNVKIPEATNNTLTLDLENLETGLHEVMVIVNKLYSSTITFEIKRIKNWE